MNGSRRPPWNCPCGLRRIGTAAAVLALLSPSIAPDTAAQTPAARQAPAAAASGRSLRLSVLAHLIERLEGEDNRIRLTFASIALNALINVHHEELLAASTSSNLQGGLDTWSRATFGYIDRLEAIAARLTPATPVAFAQDRAGVFRVMTDAGSFILSPPRLDHRSAFEQRIVDAVCEVISCAGELPSIVARVEQRAARATGHWEFGDRRLPSYRTSDGLSCEFPDTTHLHLKRQACDAVIEELRTLAEALRTLRYNGDQLEWTALRVVPSGSGRDQRVVIDSRGNFFDLSLPRLLRIDAPLALSRPWLQAQLAGQEAALRLPLADAAVYRVE